MSATRPTTEQASIDTAATGHGSAGTPGTSLWQRIDRSDLMRATVVLADALLVGVLDLAGTPAWVAAVLAVAGIVWGCWPIATEAWQDVRARRMSMELSMLLAIVAAVAIGQWFTALIITVFVLAAEILEDLCMDRGRDALTDLMSFLPATVQVMDDGVVRETPLGDVRAGQTVAVGPGGRVPVDGTVTAGSSSVDESRITGESMPRDVESGDTVFAGSINRTGALELRVERAGEESSYGQIVQAVRQAQSSRAPAQRLADQFAAWLVFIALGAAGVTFLLTRDLVATISVIIVAGACGIAAGTPLAVLASIARAARTGAFVKDGTHLERLSTIDTVVFDKTGTLTMGEPRVTALQPQPGVDEQTLLSLAAGAEWHSEHPLARSIVAEANTRVLRPPTPDSVRYEPGVGVVATLDGAEVSVGGDRLVPGASRADGGQAVGSAVHVARDGEYLGSILLSDPVRASAVGGVAALHSLGLRTLMLTGDREDAARTVAVQLGIDDVRAGLLPADKQRIVEQERAAGRRIAMVGDGVNDAAALTAADVGIAVGSGTDIAQESADMVLVGTDLAALARTVGIARRARRIVIVNFVGTIVVDLAGMVLAAFGVLGPLLATLVHVGSESAFILNSARLIPRRR